MIPCHVLILIFCLILIRGLKREGQKNSLGGSKKQPLIIKNKYIRNIDYIDENCGILENSSIPRSSSTSTSEQNHKEEFLENELCSFPSESYNNSSFLDNSVKNTLLKKESDIEETKAKLTKNEEQKEQQLELRHFYPLSEKDISLLNTRANREFSSNFVNQLLLKLYIKYPEKRFKNRFTFLSYMAQIIANEKHQGPLVNHSSFRFSCNIDTSEKNLLEYEKYLNQIEDSLDTSKDMQLKKKIAGRFSTEVAYKILTKVEFKQNQALILSTYYTL